MPITQIKCRTCGQNLVLAEEDREKRHRIVCPRCNHLVLIPKEEEPEIDLNEEMPSNLLTWYWGLLKTPDGQGKAAMILAFLSVPFLCVPFHLSLVMSGTALGMSLYGLCRPMLKKKLKPEDMEEDEDPPTPSPQTGLKVGGIRISFPVLGIFVSLMTLGLALLPVAQQ